MRNKKKLFIFITVILIVGFFAGRFSAVKAANENNLYDYMKLFTQVLTKLERNYVEQIDPKKLITASIDGMLKTLDPYTVFLQENDFDELQTTTKGKFGGLGIRISAQDDYITVISPIEGTPAWNVGLMAGDQIIKVNSTSTKGWSAKKAANNMRGPIGTDVDITVRREGVDRHIEFTITRGEIKIDSVPYAYKINDDVGYIRITNFSSSTGNDLFLALRELQEEGINGLLLDLRSNPGGLLSQAIETVDKFLSRNKLVVYTKGRNEVIVKKFFTNDNFAFENVPIIVLINEGSASAAEIFAGSLQDWDKALIVGKNSFGKGSVQQLFPLDMNSGIKITTSKYYIKSGRCIHKDRKTEDEEESEIDNQDNEEREKYYTVGGRVVFGGGGIAPDIEIVQDTLNNFEIEVRRKSLFFKFAVNFLAENEINENFVFSEQIFQDFTEFVEESEIKYTSAEFADAEEWMKNSLHSQIISNKFGMEAGNKIFVAQDIQLQNTLELFEKFQTLEEMFAYTEK